MENSLFIGKFITVEFGKRKFYLPKASCNIYIHNNRLEVFLGAEDCYAIVDGIRCYYNLNYEVDSDTLHTHLLDYEIDGNTYKTLHAFSFPVSALTFPFSRREPKEVKPRRDYSEVTAAYLSEHNDLDKRVVRFIENHPELFDQLDISIWEKLSKLDLSNMDADILDDYLTKHVADAFREETGSEVPCYETERIPLNWIKERIPLDWIKGYRKAIAAIYEQGRDKYGLRLLPDVSGIALTTPEGEVTLEPSKKKVGRPVLELNGLTDDQRTGLEKQGIAHEWFLQTRDHRKPKGVYRVTAFGIWVYSNYRVSEEESLRITVENTFKVFDYLQGK